MNVASNPTIELPSNDTPVPLAAEIYARAGFSPVRLYGMANGRCACGNPNCEPRSWAKHPIIKAWQKQATSDLDAVRDSFRGHRGNIGILLGERFVVIDVDGPEGAESLERLSEEIAWPETLTARTGSGGMHMIFQYARHQDPNAVTNRRFAPGLDVKTRGGQFVAAPSLHRSGNRYQWTVAVMPAVLPDAIYDRIRAPETKAAVIPLRNADPSELLKRARAYLDKIPPAVSGSEGHKQAFSAARALTGFVRRGLSESDAWYLLVEYNARCEPPWTEAELRHKWSEAQKATSVPSIEDRPAPVSRIYARRSDPGDGGGEAPPPDEPKEDWQAQLRYKPNKASELEEVHENAVVILRYHPAWEGRVRRDEHAHVVTVTDPPWHESNLHKHAKGTHPWTDSDSARLVSWIHGEYRVKLKTTDVDRAIEIVADANLYHPVREYFSSLEWDGVQRVRTFAMAYLGAEATRFNELVFGWWFVAVVARIFEPGCKVDNVLILEGAQGIRKSSALRALAGAEWFSDTPIDLHSKDAMVSMNGKLIIELGELESLRKTDSARQKAFFSSPVDTYRPHYGKRDVRVPRQCVFVGTVNDQTYLHDSTGNRRYWPVACRFVNLEAIERDRDQLWAEAVSLHEDGHKWWAQTPEEVQACEDAQNPRAEVDAWEPIIERHLVAAGDSYEPTLGDILTSALGIELGKWARADQMRVSKILQRLGWRRFQARSKDGTRAWRYRPMLVTKASTASRDAL